MKKSLAFILLLFTVISAFSQSVSDYEYIYVPKKFKDFETNQYNLNKQLVKALSDKKYKIIQDELSADCNVLRADLLNNSNMFRNRVILQFTDCQGKVVLENKAASIIKDYDLGFQDALKLSLETIQNSKPNPNILSSSAKETVKEKISEPIDLKEVKELSQESSFVTKASEPQKAEVFSNGTTNLQKIQTGKDQFILVSSESSLPFATFKNTTKSDVYRVTLENGTSTLGYTENGNLVIEIPTNDGNYKKVVFMVK